MTWNLLSFASRMKSFGGVLLAVLILLAMVTVHEFGHYLAGKWLGFKIEEFSVGFGPAIFKKRSKKSGVLYALRVVPLGGYCAFDGEDEADVENAEDGTQETEDTSVEVSEDEDNPFAEMNAEIEESLQNAAPVYEVNGNGEAKTESNEKADEEAPTPQGARFNDQAPWKRIIVLIAGATMNYLFALLLIIIMFASVGRPVYRVAVPEDFQPTTTQTFEGLQEGDVVLEIEGKTLYTVIDWLDALSGKKQGEEVHILVLRDGKKQEISYPLYADAKPKNMSDTSVIFYALGLVVTEESGGETQFLRYMMLASESTHDGFFGTIGHSFAYSGKLGGSVLRSLGELLTGKMSISSMGGPITTITVTAEAAANGFASFLNIAALIGVNLAVFNLLPVPALDGCKVIFCIIEWIRKKPINRKAEAIVNMVGLVVLFGFAILVDLLHFVL